MSLKSRPYEDRDLAAVWELHEGCDAADRLGDHFTAEQLGQRFATPTLDRFRDQRVWEDAEGRVLGFAQLWSVPSESSLDSYFYFRVHPGVRSTDIDSEIVEWATRHAQGEGRRHGVGAVMIGRVFEHDGYARAVFERHGFGIARYGFRMERPLAEPVPELPLPEGYTLRYAEGDEDIRPWVECFNESFVDHWGFHPETVELRRHRLQRPGYRPEQDLVAVAPDGSFAAFCLWEIQELGDPEGGRQGWIGLLGTRRGHRGKGLGRAMLFAGLRRLRDEGASSAMLGVDAENPTGALGLYERAGFHKVATRISYHKDV
jgi:mycothiol synthase